MWGSVLMLALLTAPDPLRLGATLLLISRPRALQNLLAYWAGGMTASVSCLVIPLLVLHYTPMLRTLTHDLGTAGGGADSTVGHIRIGMGVLVLVIAALLTLRVAARGRALLPAPTGNSSTLVLDADPPVEPRTAIRRFLARAHGSWDNGSVWVALLMGFGSATPPLQILVVLTLIVASGAAIGTKLMAAIAFVVGTLAIVEVVLVSYLAAPAKTQAVLRELHDWLRPRRRQVFAAILAVAGASLVASGVAGV